jgi:hypothetical protein
MACGNMDLGHVVQQKTRVDLVLVIVTTIMNVQGILHVEMITVWDPYFPHQLIVVKIQLQPPPRPPVQPRLLAKIFGIPRNVSKNSFKANAKNWEPGLNAKKLAINVDADHPFLYKKIIQKTYLTLNYE